MRPVNLTPPEERRGERAPARTGALAYVVLIALGLALAGVTATVLTSNQISDRKSEIATLQAQEAEAKARAARFQSYADLASLEQSRYTTVSSLAQSRFDWDRVLRELALVIPRNVWLTDLTGTVSPDVTVDSSSAGGSEDTLRSQIPGPALSMTGCAAGHDAVAGFVDALHDIDGVTRVGVSISARPGTTSSSTTAGNSDCATRGFIASFQLVVAFDKVQVDPTTQLPTPPAPASQPAASADQSQVASVKQQEAQHRQSVQQQTDKAHQAVSTLIPGVVTK